MKKTSSQWSPRMSHRRQKLKSVYFTTHKRQAEKMVKSVLHGPQSLSGLLMIWEEYWPVLKELVGGESRISTWGISSSDTLKSGLFHEAFDEGIRSSIIAASINERHKHTHAFVLLSLWGRSVTQCFIFTRTSPHPPAHTHTRHNLGPYTFAALCRRWTLNHSATLFHVLGTKRNVIIKNSYGTSWTT